MVIFTKFNIINTQKIIGLALYLSGFALLDFSLRLKRRTIHRLKNRNKSLKSQIKSEKPKKPLKLF